jgi:hypothetical protein
MTPGTEAAGERDKESAVGRRMQWSLTPAAQHYQLVAHQGVLDQEV